ncbi:MAG: hypothetical protein HOE32_07975 [Nitrospina sp.]|jgi:hypothetical protein|nr:hypothetical protein [Nitrospina sp.]MBT6296292.1 hypothetical protein [Nitrospina sp.]
MVSGISEVKTDITSQTHPAGGPKSNKFQEEVGAKVKEMASTEYQGEVLRNISDQTPATGINSLAKPEGSISGSGFGGYSNRAAAGLGGYAESVETTASVDQDHPVNEMGAPARIRGIAEDRPKDTKPGQIESEIGKTIDKMI